MKSPHDKKDHPYKLYTDGGVIGKNPSPYGGTWACVLTYRDRECWKHSGVLLASPMYFPNKEVTNNQSELFAIIQGLSHLPHNFAVTICSDSNVSLGRVFRGSSFSNIPEWMIAMLNLQKDRFAYWSQFGYILMNGHPTKAELAAGLGKRGYPASKWNVLCDKLCQDQAKQYMKETEDEHS